MSRVCEGNSKNTKHYKKLYNNIYLYHIYMHDIFVSFDYSLFVYTFI